MKSFGLSRSWLARCSSMIFLMNTFNLLNISVTPPWACGCRYRRMGINRCNPDGPAILTSLLRESGFPETVRRNIQSAYRKSQSKSHWTRHCWGDVADRSLLLCSDGVHLLVLQNFFVQRQRNGKYSPWILFTVVAVSSILQMQQQHLRSLHRNTIPWARRHKLRNVCNFHLWLWDDGEGRNHNLIDSSLFWQKRDEL